MHQLHSPLLNRYFADEQLWGRRKKTTILGGSSKGLVGTSFARF
jgi:hypothetical protein